MEAMSSNFAPVPTKLEAAKRPKGVKHQAVRLLPDFVRDVGNLASEEAPRKRTANGFQTHWVNHPTLSLLPPTNHKI